jgi:hypothetical protein
LACFEPANSARPTCAHTPTENRVRQSAKLTKPILPMFNPNNVLLCASRGNASGLSPPNQRGDDRLKRTRKRRNRTRGEENYVRM